MDAEKLKIAICDDDVFALDVVRDSVAKVLKKRRIPCDIRVFQKAEELEKKMQTFPFDLLLLDIDMPVTDGVMFGKRLRSRGSEIDIIYVSNREDRVFDSLKVNPFGFIRKNRFTEDVPAVLNLYLDRRKEKEGSRLVIQSGTQMISVKIEDILYIEGQRKVQHIYFRGQEQPGELKRSMQELEEELRNRGFLRVHKGYLVNYRHIRVFQGSDIILDNGQTVPMSRRKAQDVKEMYMELMGHEGNVIMN